VRRADALRDQLEQDIVTGTLRPGERLDEQGLAARFGVSRTPIREALMQLATAGLVTLRQRRGAFVASLSLKEIIERFEVMAALEGACGALAARRITDGERRELLEAHEACRGEAAGAARTPTTTRTSTSTTSSTRRATTPSSSSRRASSTSGSSPTAGCS
jgi:DNA-binding GntR family transcriptional regulator